MDRASASANWSFGRIAKYVAVALGALFALIVLLLAIFIWWTSGGVFTIDRFDQKAWFAVPSREAQFTCYRGRMAGDIKDRLLKSGIPRVDVERLLGLPDGPSNPREYQYLLGGCSGSIDDDYLHIYFDADGRIERMAIIPH